MSLPGATVLYEVDHDGVGLITLNRPYRLNAMDRGLVNDLHTAVAAAARDEAARVVILTGAGQGFCSGGDFRAEDPVYPEGMPLDQRIARSRLTSVETTKLLHEMDKPTIAMINGPVAGAGTGLAGACDLRLAGESAVFLPAYDRRGYSGDYGATYFWTKILGVGRARELFLVGEKRSAREALDFGLYHRVWPDAELRERTFAIARAMAGNLRSCWRLMKASLNAAEDSSLETALEIEGVNMNLSIQLAQAARANP